LRADSRIWLGAGPHLLTKKAAAQGGAAAAILGPAYLKSGVQAAEYSLMGLSDTRRMPRFFKYVLPQGRSLPHGAWNRRHRVMLALLWAHAAGIPLFGLARGYPLGHCLLEASPVAAAAAFAAFSHGSRRMRSCAATLGVMTSSAVLVHLSGGVIEVHFHFFVMLSIIALYNDWFPFLLALAYVVLHHGIIGVLYPEDVYNHPAAINNPCGRGTSASGIDSRFGRRGHPRADRERGD
jgi:hypothetical protein